MRMQHVVLGDAVAVFVHSCKKPLRFRMPLLRRLGVPLDGFLEIQWDTYAEVVHQPKTPLRSRIPLIRRLTKPLGRFLETPLDLKTRWYWITG